MHPCLSVDEIFRLIICQIVASEAQATAVSLARCCKGFEDPVLNALWETQDRLIPLLKCFPQEAWKEEDGGFSFKRVPMEVEWIDFRRHARRMRTLTVDTSKDTVALDTLFALQPRTANEPFLPRLKIFVCEEATEAFIPFIPSFLSRQTTWIDIRFTANTPMVMIASMITGLSTLCLDLECITLNRLPRDPVITEAVSKILLACNQDTLQWFCVDSPLTEEAREVVYRLPKLSGMWVIIQGNTLLPPVALPNLTSIDIEYDDYLGWLQGFHGATLEKLEDIYLRSKSKQIGDFLGKFGSVALTTSVSATLSTFNFNTSSSWNPNYRSLLPFTQLKDLVIGSSCGGGCSSRVDDNIIMDLVRAMPKLEILKLGDTPCETPTGVTVKGLIALAYGCCHLSRLRIHFQTASLVEATASSETPYPSNEPMVQRQDCALTDLEVGEIPVQPSDALRVAMTLLQIFPRLSNIEYIGEGWHSVGETIELSKQIGTFLHRTGDTLGIRGSPEDGRG